MTELDDHFAKSRRTFESAKQSKASTFGALIGSLVANLFIGASYALGALLVWELFFR